MSTGEGVGRLDSGGACNGLVALGSATDNTIDDDTAIPASNVKADKVERMRLTVGE